MSPGGEFQAHGEQHDTVLTVKSYVIKKKQNNKTLGDREAE